MNEPTTDHRQENQFDPAEELSLHAKELPVHHHQLLLWWQLPGKYTVKKGSRVSRPQPGCHYQTLPGRE